MNPGDRQRCRALDRLTDTLVASNKHTRARQAARVLRGASERIRRVSDENVKLRRRVRALEERMAHEREQRMKRNATLRKRTQAMIEKITAALERA